MASVPGAVLLADDHADSRAILRAMLEYEGRRVMEAEDGIECLRLARERQPDVIVLDLRMPRLDGWRTAEALKRDESTADIPILGVTACAFANDIARAIAAGCARVLTKPVPPRLMVCEIDALWARAGAARARVARLPA